MTRDSVQITAIEFHPENYWMKIHGHGHPTEFLEACREIAQSILRGRWRWWFQRIDGVLANDVELVSDIEFGIEIRFGD